MTESKVTPTDLVRRGHQAMLDYQIFRAKYAERMTENRCYESEYFGTTLCPWCKYRFKNPHHQFTDEEIKLCKEKGTPRCYFDLQEHLAGVNINKTSPCITGDYLQQLVDISKFVFPTFHSFDPNNLSNTLTFTFIAPRSIAQKVIANFKKEYVYLMYDFNADKISETNWAEHRAVACTVYNRDQGRYWFFQLDFPKQWREEMACLFKCADPLVLTMFEDIQIKRRDLFTVFLKYFREHLQDVTI